jgi:hypothetical protein
VTANTVGMRALDESGIDYSEESKFQPSLMRRWDGVTDPPL